MVTIAHHHRRPAAGGGTLTGTRLMRYALTLAAILLALMLSAAADADPPAQQQQCGPLDKIQEVLKSEYGETPAAAMEREQGPLLIFSNRETGTFTIIAMRTADAGCIIASGDGFQVFWQRPAPPPTRGAGS